MAKRRRLSRSRSRRLFRRGASRVHRRNLRVHPMRGGIRA